MSATVSAGQDFRFSVFSFRFPAFLASSDVGIVGDDGDVGVSSNS
jgi:hypothetical protein